ncbi:hypothetical protein [Paenibacillus sp. YN15]|uniref:hypothetical protein n=1 Tax=Paenibacillus sp. YN15 TaxID=1742774 RepID=UPI000DCB5888|nr:hypothetical protein [Paenibacillus sp. YN15]RAV01201.1 hypothetical protein DQG13_12515 [Paenibacillus sp. YN15]
MNRQWKKVLRDAFEAPEPADKERFLRTLRYPKITFRAFFLSQLGYIRKQVWAFALLTVLLGWFVSFSAPAASHWRTEAEALWIISAVLPLMALLTTTELFRSAFHRMAEVEMGCRFSLPQIILARAAILGVANFVLLTLLLAFVNHVTPIGLVRTALYLLVPYLMTCGICFWILNRWHGRDSIPACAAAACIISLADAIFSNTVQLLYAETNLIYWAGLFAASILLVTRQLTHVLKQTEERTWSSFLTE